MIVLRLRMLFLLAGLLLAAFAQALPLSALLTDQPFAHSVRLDAATGSPAVRDVVAADIAAIVFMLDPRSVEGLPAHVTERPIRRELVGGEAVMERESQ